MTEISRAEKRRDSGALSLGQLPQLFLLIYLPSPPCHPLHLHLSSCSWALVHCEMLINFI